jgi:hypothetical protein
MGEVYKLVRAEENKSFFKRHARFVSFAGALIVFLTFVVKENLLESWKSTATAYDTALSIYSIRADTSLEQSHFDILKHQIEILMFRVLTKRFRQHVLGYQSQHMLSDLMTLARGGAGIKPNTAAILAGNRYSQKPMTTGTLQRKLRVNISAVNLSARLSFALDRRLRDKRVAPIYTWLDRSNMVDCRT